MGMESDQEIMEVIGLEPGLAALMASIVQEGKDPHFVPDDAGMTSTW